MPKTREDYDELAGKLYDLTGSDWNIELHNVVTEPVCYYVSLYADDAGWEGVRGFIGSGCPLESACMAMEHVLEKLEAR